MYNQPTPSQLAEVRRVKAMVSGTMGTQCFIGPTGPTGPTGATGSSDDSPNFVSTVQGMGTAGYISSFSIISTVQGLGTSGYMSTVSFLKLGNVLRVDAANGNDSTASVGGALYATVNAAVNAATSGTTIWVLPGTYNLSAGITIPTGVAIRGMNVQTCIIQMLGVSANTTLLTMGENTSVEDLTLNLKSSGHHTLKGIVFGGTTTLTAKLRTCILTVDNSTAPSTGSSDVYAVECSGTGTLTNQLFFFNCLKGSTLSVYSNGSGKKRGVIVTNTNTVTTRDLNIYVAAPPTNAAFAGSYVGVETNDTNNTGSIQMRSTNIGATKPIGLQTYTSSDILQTTPVTITNRTYLISPGIQVGPGTDLVTKSAGSKSFSTYIYPITIYYGLKGLLKDGVDGYLWPGTQAVAKNGEVGIFPDSTTAAFYRMTQPTILSGMTVSLITGPTNTNNTTFTVYRKPVIGSITPVAGYQLVFTGSENNKSFYNWSQDFAAGDLLYLGVTYTGGSTNTTSDITVQLDIF